MPSRGVQSTSGAERDTAAALLVQEGGASSLGQIQESCLQLQCCSTCVSVAELQGDSPPPDPLPCPGEASEAQGCHASVSCFKTEEKIFVLAHFGVFWPVTGGP